MKWLDWIKSDMHVDGINPNMATDRECWSVKVKIVDISQTVEDKNGYSNCLNKHASVHTHAYT